MEPNYKSMLGLMTEWLWCLTDKKSECRRGGMWTHVKSIGSNFEFENECKKVQNLLFVRACLKASHSNS